jgi:hypothetical protein
MSDLIQQKDNTDINLAKSILDNYASSAEFWSDNITQNKDRYQLFLDIATLLVKLYKNKPPVIMTYPYGDTHGIIDDLNYVIFEYFREDKNN